MHVHAHGRSVERESSPGEISLRGLANSCRSGHGYASTVSRSKTALPQLGSDRLPNQSALRRRSMNTTSGSCRSAKELMLGRARMRARCRPAQRHSATARGEDRASPPRKRSSAPTTQTRCRRVTGSGDVMGTSADKTGR
jgi:hypothetical protein